MPTTDPEWTALTDEQLSGLEGQRANSEKIARQASRDLHDRIDRLNGVRREKLALSLKDLDRMLPETRRRLTEGKLNLTSLIRVGDKQDVPAVAFSCDLLTAATICDIIRSEDRRAGDSPTGVWLMRKSWSRVAGDKILTTVVDGEVQLSPAVFSVDADVVTPVAPPVVKV